MTSSSIRDMATWAIAAGAAGGLIARPCKLPEALWAVLGATSLVVLTVLPWREALGAVSSGTDVYLFLTGMMLLAELARTQGVFEWLAALAARQARGSAQRLFGLIYGVGTIVTVFLSNDATAVVLTPAVYAAAQAAKAEPMPYLLVCAFIANAASFVLPISNPANLVVFGQHVPRLTSWLAQFFVPSILSIGTTYAVLRIMLRTALRQPIAAQIDAPDLSPAGRLTACGIGFAVAALLVASAFGLQLGLPTLAAGFITSGTVLLYRRQAPWDLLKEISWSVLPLVAGLFVLVEGLVHTRAIEQLSSGLQTAAEGSTGTTSWAAGTIVAVVSNLMNNLPVALVARSVVTGPFVPPHVTGAVVIGVDLGPNLSVTGSLATILWLVALRREGQDISAWRFLRLGIVVMVPALILALAGLTMVHIK